MHYKIAAETEVADQGFIRGWYAGRKTGEPHFEQDPDHDAVLSYGFIENAREDKAFLERSPELYRDVEVVPFDSDGEIIDTSLKERLGASTVEIQNVAPLDLLRDVQQILSQIVASKGYMEIPPEQAHEQTRTALGLVLRAIGTMQRQERRDRTG